jgi:hypothetical protein
MIFRPQPDEHKRRNHYRSTNKDPSSRTRTNSIIRTLSTTKSLLIDNTQLLYIRKRLRIPCNTHDGDDNVLRITVMCRPEIFWSCPQVLQIIQTDIAAILSILPSNLRPLIQRTKLWINHTYAYGVHHQPTVVSHTTVHHHPEWLQWYVPVFCTQHGVFGEIATFYFFYIDLHSR